MNLEPLYEEAIQFNNFNGTVLAAGKVEVWYLGRTRKADIYADVAGETPLPNPFDLNNLGMQQVYVNPAFNYTLVVYDPYGSELFSIDKYLQGAGVHTTSNVVVQPSENIGVSAWTVGEVQIYQPYLIGEVGKTYEGIEPIVVNNDVNRISANNVPLGVQEPLFFVQDDENACIIGCSAQTEIPSSVSSKWEDASDTVSNNSAQWNIGTVYSPGNYINIQDDVISVTGLQPAGDYAYNSAVSSKLDTTAFSTVSGNFLTTGDSAQFYTNDNPSGFITGVDLSDYATTGDLANKLDTTAFSNVSGDFITALPEDLVYTGDLNDYAKKDFVLSSIDSSTSGLLPTSSFSSVSGSFITALPSDLISSQSGTIFVSGYEIEGTNSAVATATVQGFVTSFGNETIGPQGTATFGWDKSLPNTVFTLTTDYPPNGTIVSYSANTDLTGEMLVSAFTATKLDISVPNATVIRLWSNNWVSITGNAASADDSVGMTVGELAWASALPTYQYDSSNKISAINGSALANYELPTSVSAATDCVTANSGDWNSVTGKLETTAFSNVSGTFLTSLPQDLVYTADIQDMATTGQVAEKLDVTAFSDVSGTFLTAVDLTPYQTTAGMTAYQSAGNYYSASNPSGFITGVDLTPYQTTAGMTAYQSAGNYYSASNPSGFISEVPAGTMNESAFEYDANDKISGYNGSAFAGGSDVPEGVMVESGLEYNAVNEISGYNGSAIAQYGAEKQWLQHDDTLVHAANSAQYALGVNLSAVAQLLGVDETVLWSGYYTPTNSTNITFTEPVSAFNKIKFVAQGHDSFIPEEHIFEFSATQARTIPLVFNGVPGQGGVRINSCIGTFSSNYMRLDIANCRQHSLEGASTTIVTAANNAKITKVVGIGRKQ